jgi:hypothetical protein
MTDKKKMIPFPRGVQPLKEPLDPVRDLRRLAQCVHDLHNHYYEVPFSLENLAEKADEILEKYPEEIGEDNAGSTCRS